MADDSPSNSKIASYVLTVLARLLSLFAAYYVGEKYGLWAGSPASSPPIS